MKISRDADGLRFVGECAPKSGFVACDIQCVRCGRRIDPHPNGKDISLSCSGCRITVKVFWSVADLNVYLAENWNHLRQACTHPSVRIHG
ncbi:MAG TPA: hypothetical protein VGP65_03205 [Candidatus Angelobacter sp.]|nr:hypothetical protein [Candidatus Angelobacter sp.]